MKELTKKIFDLCDAFAADATAQAVKGNKAAGARARKASIDLAKALLEFRKASVAQSKK